MKQLYTLSDSASEEDPRKDSGWGGERGYVGIQKKVYRSLLTFVVLAICIIPSR